MDSLQGDQIQIVATLLWMPALIGASAGVCGSGGIRRRGTAHFFLFRARMIPCP